VLVLDASVMINLLASGCPQSILEGASIQAVIADRTLAEVRYDPLSGPAEEAAHEAMVGAGALQLIPLSSQMLELHLELVAASPPDNLDDGEAAAIALARFVDGTPVIDERKARRIYRERYPTAPLACSVDLFRRVGRNGNLSVAELGDALYGALHHARMRVLPDDRAWVAARLGDERAAEFPHLSRGR
jgi:hypothetical protein